MKAPMTYVCYDSSGRCLYVGCTEHVETRVDADAPSTPAGERSYSQPSPEVDSTRPPDPS